MSIHQLAVRRAAATAAAAITVIGVTATTATAEQATPATSTTQATAMRTYGTYHQEKLAIRARHSAGVAQAQVRAGGWLPANGAGVEQQPKQANQQFALAQQWQLVELRDTASAGYYNDVLLKNRQTGLCLDVEGHSLLPALLVQQTCDDSGNTPSQQWSRRILPDVALGAEQFRFWRNHNSGLVMDVAGDSTAVGARFAQYYKKPLAQANNQLFAMDFLGY